MSIKNEINMAEHRSLISLRVKEITDKVLPWGKLFAERDNFEFGYSKEEGRLVSEYLQKKPSDVLVIDSGNGREARPICRDRVISVETHGVKAKFVDELSLPGRNPDNSTPP